MNIFVILAGLAAFSFALWDFCQRLPPEQVAHLRRWYKNWMLKGLLTPFVLWIFFNSGISVRLPPLMLALDSAKMKGKWLVTMESVLTLGLFIITTYWAAITVAWLLVTLAHQAAHQSEVKSCILSWSVILGPMAIFLTWACGWRFAGFAAILWFLPVLQQVLELQHEQKPPPIYSRAIAAIHFDKHEEAEEAIIKELESCEDDFDGWMMLADLYANQFNDLPGAQELIRQTCEHPETTASQFAVAHHRLADWQLKLAQDPDAARTALEEICRHYPKSHLDRMARLRINQMPANREQWIASQNIKKIRLHTLAGSAKDAAAVPPVKLSRQEAFARSQQCVQRLETNPNDTNAREELARLWGEELGQVEMAAEQLELLLAMPGIPSAKASEWLGLQASWHLRVPQNLIAARATMERLIRLYPKSSQAIAAQRRLNIMDLEAKMRQAAGTRHERRA